MGLDPSLLQLLVLWEKANALVSRDLACIKNLEIVDFPINNFICLSPIVSSIKWDNNPSVSNPRYGSNGSYNALNTMNFSIEGAVVGPSRIS